MDAIWDYYFILFCICIDSAYCFKEVLASFNFSEELDRNFGLYWFSFDYFTKLENKAFFRCDTTHTRVVREAVFIDPNSTFLILIDFNHLGFRCKKSKTMTESFKADHWLLENRHSLHKGDFFYLTKRLHFALKLNKNFEQFGLSCFILIHEFEGPNLYDGEFSFLPPKKDLFKLFVLVWVHYNCWCGISMNFTI